MDACMIFNFETTIYFSLWVKDIKTFNPAYENVALNSTCVCVSKNKKMHNPDKILKSFYVMGVIIVVRK